jgi:two-component system nitrogen regulation sensor histidine kinase GlnL
MKDDVLFSPAGVDAAQVLGALPHPVMTVDEDGRIVDANAACEAFFHMSQTQLRRSRLVDLFPFGSPILSVAEDARQRRSIVNEYRVDVSTPRIGADRLVDVNAAPLGPDAEFIVIMLQERTIADKMDRQLTHRGAARSVSALAAMLSHEIKNPLTPMKLSIQQLLRVYDPTVEGATEKVQRVLNSIIEQIS